MTFEEILDQAIAMLQRRGRLTYGALKRQFQLDDAYLEDLKAELIEGQRLAADEDGRGHFTDDVASRIAPRRGAQPLHWRLGMVTETQELLVFQAVAKHASYARAAEELDLSPSGVYFETEGPVVMGSVVRFSLQFDNPSGDLLFLCVARVVRIHDENGKLGFGAEIVESRLERKDSAPRSGGVVRRKPVENLAIPKG